MKSSKNFNLLPSKGKEFSLTKVEMGTFYKFFLQSLNYKQNYYQEDTFY